MTPVPVYKPPHSRVPKTRCALQYKSKAQETPPWQSDSPPQPPK